MQTIDSLPSRGLFAWFTVLLLLRVVVGARYGFIPTGASADYPYGVAVLLSVLYPFGLVATVWAAYKVVIWRGSIALAVAVLASELALAFLYGRRNMLFVLVMMAGGARVGASVRRLQWWHWTTALLIVSAIVTQLAPLVLSVRHEYSEQQTEGDRWTDVRSALEAAILEGGSDRWARFSENVAVRGRLLEFNAAVADAITTQGRTEGRLLLSSVLSAVPRVFSGHKETAAWPKQVMIDLLALPDTDLSENWAAFGYADGGYVGCILMGVLFWLVLSAWMSLGNTVLSFSPVISCAIVCSAIWNSLWADTGPVLILAGARDSLLLAALAVALQVVASRRR